jgi:hypothetical protein
VFLTELANVHDMIELTDIEKRELDLTKKLLEALLLDGKVFCDGFVYSKSKPSIMNRADMYIAVNCLNRLKVKIGDYTCKVERIDAGGRPTWALV